MKQSESATLEKVDFSESGLRMSWRASWRVLHSQVKPLGNTGLSHLGTNFTYLIQEMEKNIGWIFFTQKMEILASQTGLSQKALYFPFWRHHSSWPISMLEFIVNIASQDSSSTIRWYFQRTIAVINSKEFARLIVMTWVSNFKEFLSKDQILKKNQFFFSDFPFWL